MLHHPQEKEDPELRAANDAKSALLLSSVAVDKQSRVQIGSEAQKAYEASPWNEDKDVGDVVRPAPVQTGDRVPRKSVATDVAFSKLQSRILTVVEGVQAAELLHEISSKQQAIMLSAGAQTQVLDGAHAERAVEMGHSSEAWYAVLLVKGY